MSPLLEQVLADIDRLDPQERLEIIAHLVPGWQQQADLLANIEIVSTTKRTVPESIAGKGQTLGDLISPIVDEEDWDRY